MTPQRVAIRVAARFRAAAVEADWVSGGERRKYLDAVWEMYQESYRKIGTHVSSEAGLLEYDRWEIMLDEGQPLAFNLYKTTPLGLKAGLCGTDGSPTGKATLKAHIKERYKRPGVYGEVSHAVEALAAGVPVVCAVHVPEVLHKPVVPLEDGVHYQRRLEGIGVVTKKMVGNPKGGLSGPEGSCPIPEHPGEVLTPEESHRTANEKLSLELDLAEHAACQLDLEG